MVDIDSNHRTHSRQDVEQRQRRAMLPCKPYGLLQRVGSSHTKVCRHQYMPVGRWPALLA
jgi:hypothetical protein